MDSIKTDLAQEVQSLTLPSLWLVFGVLMSFNTFVFLIARFIDDLSIVDISWGIMFIIQNAVVLAYRWDQPSDVIYLVMGLVILWGLRLAIHIGKRHKGEDYRYKIIKRRW